MGYKEQFYSEDPRSKFYNLDKFSKAFLTADVDWAPDFAVEDLLKLIESYNYQITLFATHKSELLLQKRSFVEVGLHPDNTRPDPAVRFDQKISTLKEIYPESIGLRCHRNFFGNNIGDLAKKAGLKYDASTLLWLQPFCSSFLDYNEMLRMSYFWEDGIHCDKNYEFKLDQIKLDCPGLKILNVHPILIYLNAPNDLYRREVTKQYSDLTQATYSELKDKVYKGYGIKNYYIDILENIKTRNVKTFLLKDMLN